MTEPSFTNQAALVQDLWSEIRANGLYSRKGNEFYDYVLYLLNKYDENSFLFENDNADNERLLKIEAPKIKDAKKRISVKFMDDTEYNAIFLSFLKRLADGKIPKLNDDGKSYTMVMEDKSVRSALETRLKRVANTTLMYDRNTELVTVSHDAFIKVLAAEVNGQNCAGIEDIKDLLAGTSKKLNSVKTKHDIQNCIDSAIEKLAQAAPVPIPDAIKSLGADALKAVTHYAWDKIVNRRTKEV